MIDRNITQERYRETKEMVDRLIREEDFSYSDEPYYDERTTMLEVLRVIFAYTTSRRTKSIRTPKQIEDLIHPGKIQEWLNWVHATRNGGADNGYGTKVEIPEYYNANPGILSSNRLTVGRLDGLVWASGNHRLYFNRTTGSFQETISKFTGEIIDDMSQRVINALVGAKIQGFKSSDKQSIRDNIVDLMKDVNRSSMASIPIHFREHDITMRVIHDPFSFWDYSIEDQVLEQAEFAERLRGLKVAIDRELTKLHWPDDTPYKILFFAKQGETWAQGSKREQLSINIIVQFDHLDNLLNKRSTELHIGLLNCDPTDDPDVIVNALYNGAQKHFITRLVKTVETQIKKTKRRERKQSKMGSGKIEIDAVSSHLLQIIKAWKPDKYASIMTGKTVSVSLPLEELKGFIAGRHAIEEPGKPRIMRKTERVSFTLTEGQIRSRFHINDDIMWDKQRMCVPRIPSSTMKSIIGKPAREIFDHPIADLVGPVSRAYPATYRETKMWITFAPLLEQVNSKPAS